MRARAGDGPATPKLAASMPRASFDVSLEPQTQRAQVREVERAIGAGLNHRGAYGAGRKKAEQGFGSANVARQQHR